MRTNYWSENLKRPFGSPTRRWEYNIKMTLEETLYRLYSSS